jgi:hypothetical protein
MRYLLILERIDIHRTYLHLKTITKEYRDRTYSRAMSSYKNITEEQYI